MSFSVLNGQIPHSSFFPINLSSAPSHIFRCIYFVHILTLRQDKLLAKATKCFFLCYSRIQSGCMCYSPDKNRYFIFVDVTCFEDSSSSTKSVLLFLMSLPFHFSHHLRLYPLHLQISFLEHSRFILLVLVLMHGLLLTHLTCNCLL